MRTLLIAVLTSFALLTLSACGGEKDADTGEPTGLQVRKIQVGNDVLVCVTYYQKAVDCNWSN